MSLMQRICRLAAQHEGYYEYRTRLGDRRDQTDLAVPRRQPDIGPIGIGGVDEIDSELGNSLKGSDRLCFTLVTYPTSADCRRGTMRLAIWT
jgi:hypothetical protein